MNCMEISRLKTSRNKTMGTAPERLKSQFI